MLLNPYERQSLIESSNQEEKLRLEDLAKRTNFYSIRNDKLTYNRHQGLYGFRVRNFPESYTSQENHLDCLKDPDYINKVRKRRLNLKLILIGGFILY